MTIIYELQLVVQFVRVLYMFYAQLLETIENKIVAGFSLKKKKHLDCIKARKFYCIKKWAVIKMQEVYSTSLELLLCK